MRPRVFCPSWRALGFPGGWSTGVRVVSTAAHGARDLERWFLDSKGVGAALTTPALFPVPGLAGLLQIRGRQLGPAGGWTFLRAPGSRDQRGRGALDAQESRPSCRGRERSPGGHLPRVGGRLLG